MVDCNASQHRVPFVQVLTSWVKVRFSCLIVTPSPYKTTDLSNLDTRMLSMCVCVLWEQKIKPFLKSGPQTHFFRSFKWDSSKMVAYVLTVGENTKRKRHGYRQNGFKSAILAISQFWQNGKFVFGWKTSFEALWRWHLQKISLTCPRVSQIQDLGKSEQKTEIFSKRTHKISKILFNFGSCEYLKVS